MKKNVAGLHYAAATARARAAFREWQGPEAEARREAAIQALPAVEWKGHTLRALRCHGDTGRGPHVINAPEWALWALIDLRYFHCPYHNAPVEAPTEESRP